VFKSICTILTNQNATETTKTLVDTITVPQGVRNLVGLGYQIDCAGLTTLESVTGILELESDDMSPWGGTQAFLMNGMQTALTSGAVVVAPYVHPCMIPVTPGAKIKVSATYNRAQTLNPATRAQLVFE
jgi:hypothetical protein